MSSLILLAAPIIASIAIVAKVPEPFKKIIFTHKVTCLIAATLISFVVVPHIITGVMAGYGILLCDLILYPTLLLMRKLWLRKANKLRASVGKPNLVVVEGGAKSESDQSDKVA